MSDEEFWHKLAPGRLFLLMGVYEREREDERELKALELNGF